MKLHSKGTSMQAVLSAKSSLCEVAGGKSMFRNLQIMLKGPSGATRRNNPNKHVTLRRHSLHTEPPPFPFPTINTVPII